MDGQLIQQLEMFDNRIGKLEVLESGGGSGSSTDYFTGSNGTGSTIAAFKAVASAGGTNAIKLADSGAVNDFVVIGFTTASIANAGTGQVQTGGVLTGFSGLTAGVIYYSDPSTPGGITATVPATNNTKSQIVGWSLSSTTLLIEIGPPIKVSTGGDFVTRNSTTGRFEEAAGGSGVTSVGGTAPISSSGGATPTISIAIDTTNDGGAVVKQATTPGVLQTTANFNISGTGQAGTFNGTTTVQVNGANINPVTKNWLINGNMDVCQRYGPAGSAVVAATTTGKPEVVDRWRHRRDGTGATITVSQVDFTIGQTAVPGEPTYYLRHNQTVAGSGGTANYTQQWIEDVRTLAGQTVSLSAYLTADASRTVAVRFRQFFGTGGSADVTTANIFSAAVTTSWQKFTGTLTLPSISGKTITADSALIVEFLLAANTAQRIDIAQTQLEVGANASPFQKRSFSDESRDCKRYYQKSFTYAQVPAANISPGRFMGVAGINIAGNYFITTKLPIAMRAIPTLTIWNSSSTGGANQVINYKTTTASTSITANTGMSEDNIDLQINPPVGWSVGDLLSYQYVVEDPSL